MRVKAAPGLHCPKEENPREYIADNEPVEVPDSAYYRRLVDDGSLIETSEEQGAESEIPGSKLQAPSAKGGKA